MKIDDSAYIAEGAVVLGEVEAGTDSSIWFHATVRADRAGIFIGEGSNIQDNAVVHVDQGFPVRIGSFVTIGHGAVVHGCTIGNRSLVGMGAVILNGARIGENCIIGAGALVTQNMLVPDGSLVIGCPGKVARIVTEQEMASNLHNAQEYIEESKRYKALAAKRKEGREYGFF